MNRAIPNALAVLLLAACAAHPKIQNDARGLKHGNSIYVTGEPRALATCTDGMIQSWIARGVLTPKMKHRLVLESDVGPGLVGPINSILFQPGPSDGTVKVMYVHTNRLFEYPPEAEAAILASVSYCVKQASVPKTL